MGNELYRSTPSKEFTCSSVTSRDYVPLCRYFTPVNQDSLPVHKDHTPVHQDSTPVYQDSTPVCQVSMPVYQDLMPVFQDFVPASQDLPIVKDVVLHQTQFYFRIYLETQVLLVASRCSDLSVLIQGVECGIVNVPLHHIFLT